MGRDRTVFGAMILVILTVIATVIVLAALGVVELDGKSGDKRVREIKVEVKRTDWRMPFGDERPPLTGIVEPARAGQAAPDASHYYWMTNARGDWRWTKRTRHPIMASDDHGMKYELGWGCGEPRNITGGPIMGDVRGPNSLRIWETNAEYEWRWVQYVRAEPDVNERVR